MQERMKSLIERCKPALFAYDRERKLFLSGDREFTPQELPIGYGDLAADIDDDALALPDTALVQTIMRPIMLPLMHDWLTDNMTSELLDETVVVMRDVYVDLAPDSIRYAKPDRGGFMGFDACRLRNNYPHFLLTTIGNCACLGVEIDGMWGESAWEDKVASFDFHNIDNEVQEKSLLAGLGHIAYRATQG